MQPAKKQKDSSFASRSDLRSSLVEGYTKPTKETEQVSPKCRVLLVKDISERSKQFNFSIKPILVQFAQEDKTSEAALGWCLL